jgi:hypothetical protein
MVCETNTPVAGKIFGEPELLATTKANPDFKLTSGYDINYAQILPV